MHTDSKKQETPTDVNDVLAVGLLVRLKTDHEEHRGKHFQVENIDTSLIKVSWKNRFYYFYDTELEVVKPDRMSKFYEKYYKITLPNGEQISPTLTDIERRILDKAQELGVEPYVRIFKRKLGYIYEVHPEVKAAMFQLGDFVRLGADMPYQVTTNNGLQNVNSKPYRFATDKETEVAKMYQAYKRKEGVKLQDVYDALKAIDNA